MSELYKIIKAFPQIDWKTYYVNTNSSISVKELFELGVELIPNIIYRNDVDISFVKEHPNYPWNWRVLSIKLPFKDIIANKELPWVWKSVSANFSVTVEDIENNPDLPWHRQDFVYNRQLPITFFLEFCPAKFGEELLKNGGIDFFGGSLRIHRDYPLGDLLFYCDKRKCEWLGSYYRKDLTFSIVKNNTNIKWEPFMISSLESLTFDDVKNNSEYPWDWIAVSANENISLDDIEKNPHLPWDWEAMTDREDLTWDFVKRHLKKDWDLNSLIMMPFITWEILQETKELNWDLQLFSENPNLTVKILQDNPQIKWNWYLISINRFNHSSNVVN